MGSARKLTIYRHFADGDLTSRQQVAITALELTTAEIRVTHKLNIWQAGSRDVIMSPCPSVWSPREVIDNK
jgi:hypothetical protein